MDNILKDIKDRLENINKIFGEEENNKKLNSGNEKEFYRNWKLLEELIENLNNDINYLKDNNL
jgi:hypothetical protein